MHVLGRIAKFWVLWVFVILSLYLAYYNQERVGLSLEPWIEHINLPGYLVHLAFFLLGAAVMTCYFLIDSLKKTLEIRRLTRRLRELDPEIQTLPREMAR